MFNEKYLEFFKNFGQNKFMVLSTSKDDLVTSRMISVVVIEKKFYFQTDKNFKKYIQIITNPNVSLCIDNIQINGLCYDVGKPLDNKIFCEIYKDKYPNSYKNYSLSENERLLEVNPTYIKCWHYVKEIPYIEIFNLKNQKYSMERYVIY